MSTAVTMNQELWIFLGVLITLLLIYWFGGIWLFLTIAVIVSLYIAKTFGQKSDDNDQVDDDSEDESEDESEDDIESDED